MPVKGGTNMALVFGALVAGAVVIDYGVKNTKQAFASSGASAPGSNTGSTVAGFPTSVNPVPDAVTSRADQGIDATGKTFVSPWAGTVVKATSNDPGWHGGGYIAVQSSENPDFVYYIAEGITKIVHVGQSVNAGDVLGYPVANPYNGIVGNVEFGRANPSNPGQPLAQVTGDAKSMVLEFVHWFEGLGGNAPTNLATAGHA